MRPDGDPEGRGGLVISLDPAGPSDLRIPAGALRVVGLRAFALVGRLFSMRSAHFRRHLLTEAPEVQRRTGKLLGLPGISSPVGTLPLRTTIVLE